MALKNGSIIYFKRAKTAPKSTSPELAFRGHGFGVMLGELPKAFPAHSFTGVKQALGSIGLLGFDDVSEFLGPEAATTCVRKFEDKYWLGKTPPIPPKDHPGLPNGGPLPMKEELSVDTV